MRPKRYLNRQLRVEAVAAEVLEQWRIYRLPTTVRLIARMHNIDTSYANSLLREACKRWPNCLHLEKRARGNHTVINVHWSGVEEPICAAWERWYAARTAVLAWSQRRYESEQ